MRRAVAIVPQGSWPDSEAVATVTLAYHDRHRRRVRMKTDDDEAFMLDLPQATMLRDGAGLALEGGGYIRVRAAHEAVADIFCSFADDRARIAWHIGNRHVPLQVLPGGALRILDDHVLVDMVRGLGARVICYRAPFAPESGAYAGGHDHGHDYGHDHGHGHDHEHGAGHGH